MGIDSTALFPDFLLFQIPRVFQQPVLLNPGRSLRKNVAKAYPLKLSRKALGYSPIIFEKASVSNMFFAFPFGLLPEKQKNPDFFIFESI